MKPILGQSRIREREQPLKKKSSYPYKEQIMNNTKEAYLKGDSSGSFRGIFKEEYVGSLWKCIAKLHMIDIIPFIAGENYPTHTPVTKKPGEPAIFLDLFVHYRVGIDQDAFVCLWKNWKLPCPICEYKRDLQQEDDPDIELEKQATPRRKSIYNIIVLNDEAENKKGIRIFDVANWYMDHHLRPLSVIPSRTGEVAGYIPYADPEDGKTICFERQGTGQNSKFVGHKFMNREYIIEEDIWSKAICLDEALYIPTYEEVKSALKGTATPTTTEDENSYELQSGQGAEGQQEVEQELQQDDDPCPIDGGIFGGTTGDLEGCSDCDLWDDCLEENNKQKKEERERKQSSKQQGKITQTKQKPEQGKQIQQPPKQQGKITQTKQKPEQGKQIQQPPKQQEKPLSRRGLMKRQ